MADDGGGDDGSFLELLVVHQGLFDLLIAHQEALLARDYRRSLELLLELRRRFEQHVAVEEELFVKLFSEVDSVRGTPLDLFTGEHKHLREMLASFENATGALDLADARTPRRVIELIEEEALFKSFFRHHDERERNLLYPAFDAGIAGAERRALLRRFHSGQ